MKSKRLLIVFWPLAFLLDLLTVGINHPLLYKLDKWQCGLIGHGKTYKETGRCILCGYSSEVDNE